MCFVDDCVQGADDALSRRMSISLTDSHLSNSTFPMYMDIRRSYIDASAVFPHATPPAPWHLCTCAGVRGARQRSHAYTGSLFTTLPSTR